MQQQQQYKCIQCKRIVPAQELLYPTVFYPFGHYNGEIMCGPVQPDNYYDNNNANDKGVINSGASSN